MNCEMQEMATQGININFPKRIKLSDNFFLNSISAYMGKYAADIQYSESKWLKGLKMSYQMLTTITCHIQFSH